MAGVGESLKSAGPIGIAIFILAFVGNILNWIAFTTASWARSFVSAAGVSDFYSGIGLWRMCGGGGTTDTAVSACSFVDGTNVAHFGATQAFVSIGFLGLNALFFIIVLKMFTGLCSSVGDIDKVNGIQGIVTGICYLIGIIIFGAEYGDGVKTRNGSGRDGDLGYSFILAIFAMIILIVVAVILLVLSLKGGKGGSVGTK